MDNFDLKKYLTEGKLINEFVGGELEKRNEALYDKLVPGSGAAETVEGEILRAINRVVYRWYNDGDKFYSGYGTETVGPAHSYLVKSNSPISSILDKVFSSVVDSWNDAAYETAIAKALEIVLDYIESKDESEYTPNNEDMFDYESEFEEEEEEEDDYDYGYEDEDDEEELYEEKKYKKGDKLKIKLKNGKEFDLTFDSYGSKEGMAFGKFKDEDGEVDRKPFSLDAIIKESEESNGLDAQQFVEAVNNEWDIETLDMMISFIQKRKDTLEQMLSMGKDTPSPIGFSK